MFIWTEKNITWLKSAAEYTGYYEKIAAFFLPFFEPEYKVCEIGCGMGYLSMACASATKHITAIDINADVIGEMKKLLSERNILNIEPLIGDWLHLPANRQFDIVMLSYLSAVKKHWAELNAICRGYIIAVLANGKSGSDLKGRLYPEHLGNLKGRETIWNVSSFLRENGIEYQLIEQELEFGQPLKSYGDGRDYLKRYYKIHTEKEIKAYLEAHLQKKDGFFYLPKKKKSGILIIKV
jgi:hypothetical protein